MSAYLTAGESDSKYVGQGVTLTDALIIQASAIVDGYCGRENGVKEYTERVPVVEDTQRGHLSYFPIVDIVKLKGRPKYGVILNNFFGPPAFQDMQLEQMDIDKHTGQFILSYSAYFIPFVEAEVTYTSGWERTPEAVKVATGLIINQLASRSNPNVQSKRDFDFTVTYFGTSIITPDIEALLRPYILHSFR